MKTFYTNAVIAVIEFLDRFGYTQPFWGIQHMIQRLLAMVTPRSLNQEVLSILEEMIKQVEDHDNFRSQWWNPTTWLGRQPLPQNRICSEVYARMWRRKYKYVNSWDMKIFMPFFRSLGYENPVYPLNDKNASVTWDADSELGLARRKLLKDLYQAFRARCEAETDPATQ